MTRFLALPAVALLAACGPDLKPVEITATREVSVHATKPALNATSAQRFYDNKDEAGEEGAKQHPLVWKTPEGWTEGPATQMRMIDFKFGPSSEGECYLTAIPGGAGGLLANVNRWRGQMGLESITEADVAKLEKRPLMGAEAFFTVLDGSFKGMGDAASAKPDYRMLGLIQSAPELTLFVKMTGPKALVEAQQANFDAFVSSVQFRKAQGIPMH